MSDPVRSLYAEVEIKDNATAPLEQLDNSMEGLVKSLLETNKEMLELAKAQAEVGKESEETAKSIGDMARAFAGSQIASSILDWAGAAREAYQQLDIQRQAVKNLYGPDGLGALQESIKETISQSKGLADESSLLEASRNALELGASFDFVKGSMNELSKVAQFTGSNIDSVMAQAQEAVASGNDEFFRTNKIYGDSLKEFKKIGAGLDEVSKKKREAFLLNSLQEHSNELQGKYNDFASDSIGIQKRFSNGISNLQTGFGELLTKGLIPIISAFLPLIEYFTDAEDGTTRLTVAVIALAPVLGTVLVSSLYSVATAGWAMIAPFAPFIAIALAVGAAIAGLTLIVEDFLTWMEGGDSVIGDFFGPFVDFKDKIKDGIDAGFAFIKKSFMSLIDFAKKMGKFLIMAMFPISILFFYWDEINAFLGGIPEKVLEKFQELGSNIKDFVKDLLPDWAVKLITSTVGGGGSSGGVTNVNDAIITKTGEVVQTHPDDNLFITKSSKGFAPPGSMGGGGLGGGGVMIQNLVGSITITVTGGAEAGDAIKVAVMDAINELSNSLYRAELGMAPV